MRKAYWISDCAQVPKFPDAESFDLLVVSIERVTTAAPGDVLRIHLDGKKAEVESSSKTGDGSVVASKRVSFPPRETMMLVADKQGAKELLCEAVDSLWERPPFDMREERGRPS